MGSLEIQIKSYTQMIENCPDWIFAGVFYDIGSGLRRSVRTGIESLLKKAKRGKVDYILTKSISRVSRDTLELLKIIRFLRERGINMYFENEDLDSIKQEKEFEIFMGYTCVDGEIVIVPEQAEIVSEIFKLYLQGLTFGQIKTYLESMGIKTVTGNNHWDKTTIQKMLKNEKLYGDARMQKTYTVDFLTKKRVKNDGYIRQYYG